MRRKVSGDAPNYRALAAFRYELRRFLRFSEQAARRAELEPQQHQLLLAIKGLPASVGSTIGVLAERLQIQHHSAVELINRSEGRGLIRRSRQPTDHRKVLVLLTKRGEHLIRRLSVSHHRELRMARAHLLQTLQDLSPGNAGRRGKGGFRGEA